jgi:hypothetical protein
MRLTVDGEIARLEPIQASFSGWSHGHLICLFKADIQLKRQRTKIVVTDGNFADDPGNYRIAMKGRSGAKIEKASVPPLVSRAKPVALVKLAKPKKQAAVTAQGEAVLDQLR